MEIREKFSLEPEQNAEFLKRLKVTGRVSGAVGLFTCNRSEIYISGDERYVPVPKSVRPYVRRYTEEDAVRHLFRVSAGIESAVLGEDEILGQVKRAYELSLEAGVCDRDINMMFREAASCAKRIKTDTALSTTPVSTATLAANKIFEHNAKTVMILGATGKIGSAVAKNIAARNVRIIGTGRRRHMMTGIKNLEIVEYRDRYLYMNKADAVVSATRSPHYTVTAQELEGLSHMPGLFIDMAVPRDIDPLVGEMAKLYDIDDFRTTIDRNMYIKENEACRAEEFAETSAREAMKQIEFRRYLHEVHTNVIDNKILYALRDNADLDEMRGILRVLRRLV